MTLPIATFNYVGLPNYPAPANDQDYPVTGITLAVTLPTVVGNAMGRVPDGGRVMVEVDGAATLTIRVYSPLTKTWRLPSADSGSYQKTFAAAGMDYFDAPPGALFHITATAGVHMWLNCLAV